MCPIECGAKYTSTSIFKRKRKLHACGRIARAAQALQHDPIRNEALRDNDYDNPILADANYTADEESSDEERDEQIENIHDAKEKRIEDNLFCAWTNFFEIVNQFGCTAVQTDIMVQALTIVLSEMHSKLKTEVNKELYLMGQEYSRAVHLWLERTSALRFPQALSTSYRREKSIGKGRGGKVNGQVKQVPVSTFNRPGKHGCPGYATQYNRSIADMIFEEG